ncbi:M23 family metallopeptidase [Thalassospiraceae bacterium LMO-JJ14]|nr:M23 family metallopeptidase [Thalassospiraceae bacterium LMO-JJ14]
MALILGLFMHFPAWAGAEAPVFSLPADCVPGTSCWVVNFVDHDPGPGARDYRCGRLSYDTHKGTDIAIANDAVMQKGVDVLAAAPGRVLRVRDGVANSTKADLESATALRGRECGNGLIIDHGDDWSTQYCHMKAGSIRVQPGERVERGAVLGRIGRSGRSEFPHIHLAVRQGTRIIDPFTGESNISACAAGAAPAGLWAAEIHDALAYPGPQPFHLGFATEAPNKADIEAGRLSETRFAAQVPALVFWSEIFSLEKGDRITLTLTAPDGKPVAHNRVTIDRPLAKWHGFAGRKKRGAAWDSGTYTGHVMIERGAVRVGKSTVAVVE